MRSRSRRGLVRLAIGTVAASLITATPLSASSATEPPAGGEVDRSASFRFAITYGFNSFDPHRTPAAVGDYTYLRVVYDSLLSVTDGPSGVEPGPQLATSYEISEGGKSISFELRDDVTFQDGTRFNAEAVRANIERAKDAESTVASTITNLETVEVVDDTHVVFHLATHDPSVLWAMATTTVGLMVNPAAFDTDLAVTPAGSGPFTLVSAQKDAEAVFERWDDYWDPDAAQVQELTIASIADGNARFNGLRSGELDGTQLTLDQAPVLADLEAEGYHVLKSPTTTFFGVLLNANRPPLDDVRVRQAIWKAINRTEISEQLLGGISPPVYQPFLAGVVGYDVTLDVDPFDPEEARRLVSEAGADGTTLDAVLNTTQPVDQIALVVQQALGDIGLNIEFTPLSGTEAPATWREGGHDIYLGHIIGRADPASTLATSYLTGYNPAPVPPELAEMADAALALPFGSAEREDAYKEISRYLVENPVHVPIAPYVNVVVARPDAVGAENLVAPVVGLNFFERVGIAG